MSKSFMIFIKCLTPKFCSNQYPDPDSSFYLGFGKVCSITLICCIFCILCSVYRVYAIYKCRHYYLRLPEILYAICKCRLYSLRLPEILYAICKCRLYSVQSRLFCTTISTHTFSISRLFCCSLRLVAASC